MCIIVVSKDSSFLGTLTCLTIFFFSGRTRGLDDAGTRLRLLGEELLGVAFLLRTLALCFFNCFLRYVFILLLLFGFKFVGLDKTRLSAIESFSIVSLLLCRVQIQVYSIVLRLLGFMPVVVVPRVEWHQGTGGPETTRIRWRSSTILFSRSLQRSGPFSGRFRPLTVDLFEPKPKRRHRILSSHRSIDFSIPHSKSSPLE